MVIARLLLGLWLIILVGQTTGGWWSRSCSRVDCAWHDWSAWGACDHPCGNAGTQRRSRGIARSQRCGGSGCSGPSSEAQDCNRFCDNSGTPQSGYCDCPAEYWDTCCDKRKSKTTTHKQHCDMHTNIHTHKQTNKCVKWHV